MCTAISLQTRQGKTFFGRTMDFSYSLDPEVFVVPKHYQWNNLSNTHRISNRYSFIGIGQNISPVILADGVNEMGLAAAALYFPGYASYDEPPSEASAKVPVAALELVNFLLGVCGSVRESASILSSILIVGVKDSVTHSVAPLHWIIADKTGACMTIEKTAEGLHLLDNSIGVLSNSPDFNWHMTNLRNYMNLSPYQYQEAEWNSTRLTPFGQGGGSFGLPGGFTPTARFVRAAYTKNHTDIPDSTEEAVTACFHIMENISIPKGMVMTDRGTPDYTQYTAFIDISSQEYFFRTYDNSQTVSVSLSTASGNKTDIVSLGKLNEEKII